MTDANPQHADIERQLLRTQSLATGVSPDPAIVALQALHARVGTFVEASKAKLLSTPFDWTDAEKAEAEWIYATHHRIAALGFHLTEIARRNVAPDDARMTDVVALTLFYAGEAMKWENAGGTRFPRDYRALHALMRRAISSGRQRVALQVRAAGRVRDCTVESLYFRALLLARFASGTLGSKQIEILDEWLWLWSSVLVGVDVPPAGSALRADLDSAEGLRRGPREGEGPALYLPQGPIEAAFRSLLKEFHAGRIVPAEGCTADFRIEEHIAVLDLIRRGLRTSLREPAARAQRQAMERTVELYVGLAEITARGFVPGEPRPIDISLATKDGVPQDALRAKRERDLPLDGIYDPAFRRVTLSNVSATGLGLEGSQADCGMLAVNDLVAVRISASEPLVIGKVMRCIPAAAAGRVIVGVSRISSAARPVQVTGSASRGTPTTSMLYVPGDDASGCRDAYLVGERTFEEGGPLEVTAGEHLYRFRFNRVRARGRGWVLAGFEVLAARLSGQVVVAM